MHGGFTADTTVTTKDGTRSIRDLYAMERFGCFSCIPEARRVVSKLAAIGLSRKNADIIRIVLDNGAAIRCSGDQRFLLSDGTPSRADCLVRGTRMMPTHASIHSPKNIHLGDIPGSIVTRVASLQATTTKEDVYTLVMDDLFNFAVGAGVFGVS